MGLKIVFSLVNSCFDRCRWVSSSSHHDEASNVGDRTKSNSLSEIHNHSLRVRNSEALSA